MGQYMLKGYRMLDKSCPICGTVLLQTPMSEGGTKYCVGCIDVDGGNFSGYSLSPTIDAPKIDAFSKN